MCLWSGRGLLILVLLCACSSLACAFMPICMCFLGCSSPLFNLTLWPWPTRRHTRGHDWLVSAAVLRGDRLNGALFATCDGVFTDASCVSFFEHSRRRRDQLGQYPYCFPRAERTCWQGGALHHLMTSPLSSLQTPPLLDILHVPLYERAQVAFDAEP